jgi:proteasome lid subunit RPN8/RPN11
MIQQNSLMLGESVIHDLKTLAIQGYPFEVCGVLHAHNIIHQYANTFVGDRTHGFDMEIDVHDTSIKAIWHSHPNGLARPSNDDIPCMESLARHGYNYPWLIVTPRSVTEWIFESANVA